MPPHGCWSPLQLSRRGADQVFIILSDQNVHYGGDWRKKRQAILNLLGEERQKQKDASVFAELVRRHK